MRYDGNGEIEHPISIPSDILESILGKVDSAYESFTSYSKRIKQLQEKSRELLESENKIKNCQDGRAIDFSDIYGVDGTYAIKRSVTADVYVIASILFGNDRLYPKSETFVLPPSDHSTRIAQGVMTILEIECLHPPRNNAVVLYDGSFLTPIIKLNSLYSDYNKNLTDFRFTIRGTPIENIMDDFRQKKTLSDAIQTKRVFAIPKESSASSISSYILQELRSDINIRVVDKVLLSGVLQTGEYVLGDAGFGALHLPTEPDNALYFPYGNEIISVVENVRVMYIKPASWSPVQRIEFSADLSKVEINNLAKTIMELFISPTITEPYPLFITDRICKAISNPADAVLASLLNRLTKEDLKEMGYSDEDLQWILRPYRTEV